MLTTFGYAIAPQINRKDILCLKTKTEKSRKEHEKKAKKKSGKNVSKRERMSSLGMPE